MGVLKDQEIDRIFYDNWLDTITNNPEHCEYLYGLPPEEVLKDPEKYYNMDGNKKAEPERTEPEPELEMGGLFE